MLTYLFQCRECRTEYESAERNAHGQTCDNCGGRLRRVFALAGVSFKGSGFYVNDKRQP